MKSIRELSLGTKIILGLLGYVCLCVAIATVMPGAKSATPPPKTKPIPGPTGSPAPGQPEKQTYCRIYSCETDQFHKILKQKRTGSVNYFGFSPRGLPGFPGRGAQGMYYRPGARTKADSNPVTRNYDEIWTETVYADAKSLADITYIYWKNESFVVAITYSFADLRYVPSSMLANGAEPSRLERFLYKSINNEWFVLDHVSDRIWFDDEVKGLE